MSGGCGGEWAENSGGGGAAAAEEESFGGGARARARGAHIPQCVIWIWTSSGPGARRVNSQGASSPLSSRAA